MLTDCSDLDRTAHRLRARHEACELNRHIYQELRKINCVLEWHSRHHERCHKLRFEHLNCRAYLLRRHAKVLFQDLRKQRAETKNQASDCFRLSLPYHASIIFRTHRDWISALPIYDEDLVLFRHPLSAGVTRYDKAKHRLLRPVRESWHV